VKRLQQSKVKPGVNTATLTEAIHQTLTELRAINCSKEAKDLVGSEIYKLLVETLNINVIDILRKVIPAQHQLQKYNNNRLTTSQNKSNAFSIENLLSTCGGGGGAFDSKKQTISNKSSINEITQPIGFLVNTSSPSIDYHDDDDDDSDSSDDSSVGSEYMSPHHEWASSPELDVTDEPEPDDYSNANGIIDVSQKQTKVKEQFNSINNLIT
jgi:hypothetical protein